VVVRFRAPSRAHCLIVGLCLAACSRPPRDLPTFGAVAPFTLTSEAAQNFDSKTLEGKVWVADFIYTSCSGPCPRMGSQMRQVQNAFLTNPDVKLVSFTVDPANDTPQVLADYAKRMKAAPDSWRFLTGPPEQLERLMLRCEAT
jgi:protein SCO1